MPNPLFPVRAASKAIQDAVKAEFRRSSIGRRVVEFERLLRGRSLKDPATRRRVLKHVEGLTKQRVLSEMKRTELGRLAVSLQQFAAGKSTYERVLTALFQQMGPVGRVLAMMLKDTKRPPAQQRSDLDAAIRLLQAHGFAVIGPAKRDGTPRKADLDLAVAVIQAAGGKVWGPFLGTPAPAEDQQPEPEPGPGPEPDQPAKPKPRPSAGGEAARQQRIRKGKPPKPGEEGTFIRVSSSNVYAIGYDRRNGILAVRYLATDAEGNRSGPGPLYHYRGVPARLWDSFKGASSKGKWVWDNLRIRGTVSGHRFDYELADITDGYVPRKATFMGHHSPEWYIRRTFIKNAREYTSSRPDMPVGGGLRFGDGSPNRAAPRRPNNGRR